MSESAKSTVDEIRTRFDRDVERFSNLETGQSATVDAPLVLDLVTAVAAAVNPQASSVLDIGCGAGNYTLKLLSRLPDLDVTLVDLSRPMLDRAVERTSRAGARRITPIQGDIREITLADRSFDVVLAAAVLHHLREEREWHDVFAKVRRSLKPGGTFWIADLVAHDDGCIQGLMWGRYGQYLESLRGADYRDEVFAYVAKEDTPRSLGFQLAVLKEAGFTGAEVLHKNGCFAAFGAFAPVD